jgi:hypothetical protein
LWGDIIRGADRRRFGVPTSDENGEMMYGEHEEELDGGLEDMEPDIPEVSHCIASCINHITLTTSS